MNTLPEAVVAAEALAGKYATFPTREDLLDAAAIISSAFAPLVEERDKWRIVAAEYESWAGTQAILLDQLQAKLDAVVKAGEAAVNAYPHLVDLEEALRKAKE